MCRFGDHGRCALGRGGDAVEELLLEVLCTYKSEISECPEIIYVFYCE